MWARKFIISFILLIVGSAYGRVLSLDLAADQWVLGLCPKEKIYAVTYLARMPLFSFLHQKAQNVPIHRGNIEDFLDPTITLIIGHRPIPPLHEKLFKKTGAKLILLESPSSIQILKEQIEHLTHVFNRPQKRAIWLQKLNRIQKKNRPKILLFTGHRHAPGQKTLFGELLTKMGYKMPPYRGWQYLSLEKILVYGPQHIFYTEPQPNTPFWKAMSKKTHFHRIQQTTTLTPYPDALFALMAQIEKVAP